MPKGRLEEQPKQERQQTNHFTMHQVLLHPRRESLLTSTMTETTRKSLSLWMNHVSKCVIGVTQSFFLICVMNETRVLFVSKIYNLSFDSFILRNGSIS